MAIPVQFQQFKSAGIYRVVYDKSTVLGQDAELLRLVVGYSPKGPFNTPVYVKSVSEFKSLYGDISKSLEKRGCFFHRTCIQALNAGPILCLNLKPFDSETVGIANISDNIDVVETKVTDIYNSSRFWKLDPDKLNDGRNYIRITATDSKETSRSFFIRKAPASKVSGYNVTIADWYNTYNEQIPDFLVGSENLKLSDLFAEVYVFSGEFKAETIEASSLSKYFEDLEHYTKDELVTIDGVSYVKSTCKDNLDGKYSVIKPSEEVTPIFVNVDGENKIYSASEVTKLSDGKYYVTSTLVDGESGEGTIEVKIREYVNSSNDIIQEGSVTEVENKFYVTSTLVDGAVTEGSLKANEGDLKLTVETSLSTPLRVRDTIKNSFDEDIDALDALFNDSASGGIGHYIGCLIPNFIDYNTGYKALDILFNVDSDTHSLMMSMDENMLIDGDDISVILNNAALKNESANREPRYLKGYEYLSSKPADSSILAKYNWQKKILSTLSTDRGLRTGLLSAAEIEYRYIVDSFDSYYNATDELKSELSLLAKQKELCFAIINFPSISNLVKQSPETFTKNGVFDINKIPSNIKLPSETNGASFCGIYTPLKFSDGYVDTIVPSAGLVSNLFMAKYNGREPYSIIAGPNYANIKYTELVGPDYHYQQEELHIMEPFGVNCIIYRPTFGTFVNSNQTAKQTPKTALSSINVRELVIYLQDEIGKILQAYQWEFNNQNTRDAIKNKADLICEQARSNGGIIKYLNVMDESNNTPEIIDNEFCVLSTHIEPGRGMGKMVHELTIYRTGGMSSVISEE